jgi:diacylglycerol O-acyltransferase / wax synthase
MRRLTGLDASFLYLETPNNHMHVGAVYVFDPAGDPAACSFDRVKATLASRLHLIPPFRWKLVEVPFGLHHPLWVNDPDFDIENHVRRSVLSAPGGAQELAESVEEFMASQLDRSRPLWELEVVEGLAGGRVAFMTKTHHAAIDGVSGAELTTALFDLEMNPEMQAESPLPFAPDRIPSELEVLAYGLKSLALQPARIATTLRRTGEMALNLRSQPGQGEHVPASAFSAPRTSFNVPISPRRKFANTQFPLADIKTIGAVFGATVNDVVLASCASALRRYLLESDQLPVEPLIAMVPMSIRSEGEAAGMGNRVTQLLVRLATHEPEPFTRLESITAEMRLVKEQANTNGPFGADILTNWAQLAPPALAERAAKVYSSMGLANQHKPVFNVTISNIPGPQIPLYSAGAQLVEWYPMGPIFDGVGLNITVMSYRGTVYFGLLACPDSMNDLEALADHLNDGVVELLDAARSTEIVAPGPELR